VASGGSGGSGRRRSPKRPDRSRAAAAGRGGPDSHRAAIPGRAEWIPDLHFDDSVHVITLIVGRLDIVLEVGEVTLGPGDSVVLPASVHDLRNTTGEPATFVYTSFPLIR
jgi:mannose-6-phosphate isomerase-like protein (cupin superfamily)